MLVDGAPVERIAAVPVRPLVGVFLPDRLELVKGAPASRRAHLDQLVAALWPARADDRGAYRKALAQRNALVARIRAGGARADLLDTWDAELARHGVAAHARPPRRARAGRAGLHAARRRPGPARARASSATSRARRRTTPTGLVAELARAPRTATSTAASPSTARTATTSRCIHGDRPLRTLGSQGQQRAGLLALLFAERDALLERERPSLMLLDDVMSELDATRRARLAELVRAGGQALITTTEADHVPGRDADDVARGRGPRRAARDRPGAPRRGPMRRLAPRPLAEALAAVTREPRAADPARPRPAGLARDRRRTSREEAEPVSERAGTVTVALPLGGLGAGAFTARARPRGAPERGPRRRPRRQPSSRSSGSSSGPRNDPDNAWEPKPAAAGAKHAVLQDFCGASRARNRHPICYLSRQRICTAPTRAESVAGPGFLM